MWWYIGWLVVSFLCGFVGMYFLYRRVDDHFTNMICYEHDEMLKLIRKTVEDNSPPFVQITKLLNGMERRRRIF